MEGTDLAQRIAPLLAAMRQGDGPWYRRFLADPEALRTFSAIDNELFVRGEGAVRTLAVASAARGEGRSTLALLLAVYAAGLDAGLKVLLVDADIGSGRLGEALGLDASAPGLDEFFSGKAAAAQCIHPTALANLSLAPVARIGHRPAAFAPRPFEAFLSEAGERFDLVVVDTPAGGTGKAVLSIARLAGRAVLVVRYGGPTREQVAAFLADLNRAGTQVVGCVMNRREYVVPAFLYGYR